MSYISPGSLIPRSGGTNNDVYENSLLYKHLYPSPDTDQYVSTTSVCTSCDYSLFSGFDTPNFHRRRKAGELLPSTPWYKFHSYGSTEGHYSVTTSSNYPSQWTKYFDKDSSTSVLRPEWRLYREDVEAYSPGANKALLQEAAAKIYSEGHDTLTFIAELADVRKMFYQVGKSLLTRSFMKIDLDKVTSRWLATRYGWRTLIYDLEDLSKALSNLSEKRTRYSKKAKRMYSTSATDVTDFVKTHYTHTATYTDTVKVSLVGAMTADCTIPKFQFNPLQTGWELIPFSFVIDWFVSVGKALAVMSYLSADVDYVSSCGLRIDVTRSYNREITDTGQYFIEGYDWQTATCTAYVERRLAYPVPYLPQFNVKLNNFKILDLIALVLQRIGR